MLRLFPLRPCTLRRRILAAQGHRRPRLASAACFGAIRRVVEPLLFLITMPLRLATHPADFSKELRVQASEMQHYKPCSVSQKPMTSIPSVKHHHERLSPASRSTVDYTPPQAPGASAAMRRPCAAGMRHWSVHGRIHSVSEQRSGRSGRRLRGTKLHGPTQHTQAGSSTNRPSRISCANISAVRNAAAVMMSRLPA